VRRSAYPDEGAERPDQRRRRYEVRQRRLDAVIETGEVVPELVRQKDGEQCERKRQAVEELAGACQHPPHHQNVVGGEGRQVAVEIVCHPRSDRGGGQECQEQKKKVQPNAPFPYRAANLQWLALRAVLRAEAEVSRGVSQAAHNRIRILPKLLQLFAGLESNRFSGRDRNLRASSGVPADASLARTDVEDAKATKLDAFAAAQGTLHAFENRFHCHLGFRLGDSGPIHYFVDDIGFNQNTLLV